MANRNEYNPTGNDTSRSQQSEENIGGSPRGAQAALQSSKTGKMAKRAAIGAGGAGIVFFLYHYVVHQFFDPELMIQSQYQFKVYCPINKVRGPDISSVGMKAEDQLPGVHDELRLLAREYQNKAAARGGDQIDQYLIYIQMRNTSSQTGSNVFFYCSYVTDWANRDNCNTAKAVCSVPGPIFYVNKNVPIEVAWVYNIEQNGHNFSVPYTQCYNQSQNQNELPHCRINRKKAGFENCTYLNPTDLQPSSTIQKSFIVSTNNIPNVVHVHGLEVRPTFDGNPLSWLGKDGVVGTGFTSLMNDKYYSLFSTSYSTTLVPDQNSGVTYYCKVNRYENFQPAGNLWYHDHSMHATQGNVALGMAGDYIIHDPEIDQGLPDGKYEVFIVAGQNFNSTNNTMREKHRNMPKRTPGTFTNPDIPFVTQTGLSFERNQTYRIRILNGQFDSVFQDLQFMTDCDESDLKNFRKCNTHLGFSVIGSDSSIFDQPVPTQSISVASSQRFQFLIVFDGNKGAVNENSIGQNARTILMVSPSTNVVHNNFTLEPKSNATANNYPYLPKQLTKINGAQFYDLNQVSGACSPSARGADRTKCVSVQRMRPIMHDVNFNFFFNGHYEFSDSGASDNPKIGTTEDWYFINTMGFGHPIHVHLINYQIIAKTELKRYTYTFIDTSTSPPTKTSQSCSYYEMDYYRFNKQGIVTNQTQNLTKLCEEVRNLDITQIQDKLTDYTREDQVNPGTDVSGLDIHATFGSDTAGYYNNSNSGCTTTGNFKYICQDFSNQNIPLWYRKWKEVAYVNGWEAFQVRIRWTKTDYNENEPYPYFSVPEDHLIEHPGFVYHCHFLQHEDNELMRSFMMQPSDEFAEHYKVDPDSDLGKCMASKGKDLAGGWPDRYECINQLNGCKA